MTITDDELIAYEFLNATPDFQRDLQAAFPENDFVTSSAFSGKEILALIASRSKLVLEKLAQLIDIWSKRDDGKKIRIKIRDSELELSGFGTDDVNAISTKLETLIGKLSDK